MVELLPTLTETDRRLLAALKRNARASISELAVALGVTRSTARTRMERLTSSGHIRGFTILTAADVETAPVRGLMMLSIEGAGSDRITRELLRLPEVSELHATNGKWDLIVEIATETLKALDDVLAEIRRLPGVSRSETNLLLSTRRGNRV